MRGITKVKEHAVRVNLPRVSRAPNSAEAGERGVSMVSLREIYLNRSWMYHLSFSLSVPLSNSFERRTPAC